MKSIKSKNLALIYRYVKEHQPVTSSAIWTKLPISRPHVLMFLKVLAENGYLSCEKGSGARPNVWSTTDKEFLESISQNISSDGNTNKWIKITIKPDQAAMWFAKSQPQWVSKWIPIVRSIGLGVKQSTL